jgi:WD40 repeat protein
VGQHEKSIVVWDFAGQKKANQFEVPGGFPHAVSSDGKLVALTIQFGIAEIRSVDQGKVLWEFSNDFPKVLGQKQPHELLSSMAFSPDGKTLATVGSWAVPGAPFPAPVRLWDIAEKKHVWSQLQPENPGYIGQQLKFSPKGEFVSLLWTTLMLLDAKTGKIAHEYPTSTGDGLNYAVSPDGKRLARAAGRRLRLWTLADHKEPVALVGPKSPAQLIARSPDGKFIATGNGGKEVWIWNSSENSPNAVRTASARAIEIGFSPDSKFLLTISRGDSPPVRIWSTKSNKLFSQFGWSAAVSHRAAFGRHGLFTVLDHVPGLYDAVTEKAIWTGKAITSFGNNDPLVVISPLAEYYATDTGVYSVATGNQVSQANPGFPLAVSDDGKRIIYRNKEGQIGLHTTTSISQPKPIAVGSVFAFSPQRDRMAMVSGLALKVIDLNTGKAVCECERPAAIDPETWKKWWARNVQFSPDGKRLVAQGETNGLGVWDAETGISLAWFAPLDSLPLATYSFSDPQTITAAYGQGDQIIVWSLNAKPK